MSLFGRLFGGGRGENPLELDGTLSSQPSQPSQPSQRITGRELGKLAATVVTMSAGDRGDQPFTAGELRELEGLLAPVLQAVRADPRAYGFDLLPVSAMRRSVLDEVAADAPVDRQRTAMFLAGHAELLRAVPSPPTTPDGHPIDTVLVERGRLDADVATDVAHEIRVRIQASLGAPIDQAGLEHVVREVAWERDIDERQLTTAVIGSLALILV